jgi:hypothetical protein
MAADAARVCVCVARARTHTLARGSGECCAGRTHARARVRAWRDWCVSSAGESARPARANFSRAGGGRGLAGGRAWSAMRLAWLRRCLFLGRRREEEVEEEEDRHAVSSDALPRRRRSSTRLHPSLPTKTSTLVRPSPLYRNRPHPPPPQPPPNWTHLLLARGPRAEDDSRTTQAGLGTRPPSRACRTHHSLRSKRTTLTRPRAHRRPPHNRQTSRGARARAPVARSPSPCRRRSTTPPDCAQKKPRLHNPLFFHPLRLFCYYLQ